MTIYSPAEIRCGICGTWSRQRLLVSTNAFGPCDLDLRPPGMERWTMDGWVQRCPRCGYCGDDLSKPTPGAEATVATEEYQSIVHDPDLPALACSFRAEAMLVGTTDPRIAARAHLASAWVCDDSGHKLQAIQCRKLALGCFLRWEPAAEEDEASSVPLVIIDLLRRTFDFERALSHCVELRLLSGEDEATVSVLDFQESLIAAHDAGVHTVPERPPTEKEMREEEERRRDAERHREAWERECAEKLERDSVTEMQITSRRCSDCGKPCPRYRETCKYCGAMMGRLLA